MRSHGQRGITLIELLIALAVAGLFLSIGVPALLTIQRHAAARAASGELRAIFHACRSRAIARAANTAVKFTSSGGEWRYALYDDGNGNGVRNNEIASGVDRCFAPPRRVLPQGNRAFIGLPPFKISDPDGDPLPPTGSPVQFGSSTLCSFSPIGQATPGTVYLTDRVTEAYAVRVAGAGGRVRLLRWSRGAKKWEAR